MRLVYVVPGPMSCGPMGREELERRRSVLQRAAFPGTEVDVVDVPDGPLSIESAYEGDPSVGSLGVSWLAYAADHVEMFAVGP